MSSDLSFLNSEHDCDESARECSMCGAEFCALCFPNSRLCSDCAETVDLDNEEDADPDFEDVPDLDKLIALDEDAARIMGDDNEPEPEEEKDA